MQVSGFLREHHQLMLDDLIGTTEDWELLYDIRMTRPEMVTRLDEVRDFICDTSPFFKHVYSSLVEMIIPLRQHRARGYSSDFTRGVIFLGFEPNYPLMELALDLVHEMGHQALSLFVSADRVISSDWESPVYSQVRKTNRPAIQSLHAAVALAYMSKFVRDARQPDYCHHDFELPVTVVLGRGLAILREACKFTEVGEQILQDFQSVAA